MNIDVEKLRNARFFGTELRDVEILRSQPLGNAQWYIIATPELYQVLIDDSGADALHTPTGATSYTENLGLTGTATAISGEQSNTSLVVGEHIVKVFRRLEPGLNPDIELLTRIGDNPHVAKVTDYRTIKLNGQEFTLNMVQDFVAGQDGFELALQSPDIDAHSLGRAIRSVHGALAQEFGLTTREAIEVPRLEGFQEQLDNYFSETPSDFTAHRIHGDLHLGQTLHTGDDWVLIDFEGEPTRTIEQRREPDSPMRDLAGMIRSFSYAESIADHPQGWADTMTEELLAGYGDVDKRLLDAYVLSKACYEVEYERSHRPDWVHIPMHAVTQILL